MIKRYLPILKDMKAPSSQCDEVEMGPHDLSKSLSKSTAEPQYEVCGGCVTSTDLAIEENLLISRWT